MYRAEFIMKLTSPKGVVRERRLAQEDTDFDNLQATFVETIFARGSTMAENLFEGMDKEPEATPTPTPEPDAPPPPPPPADASKEGRRHHGRNKGKDPADAKGPEAAGGPGKPAPAVVGPVAAEKPAPPGEKAEGAAPAAGTPPA